MFIVICVSGFVVLCVNVPRVQENLTRVLFAGELVERLYRDRRDCAGPGRSGLPQQRDRAEGRLVDRVRVLGAEGRPVGAGGVRP